MKYNTLFSLRLRSPPQTLYIYIYIVYKYFLFTIIIVCQLYTYREEHWFTDHRQSSHRQSDRISPEMRKEEHQLHKIKQTITMPLTLEYVLPD